MRARVPGERPATFVMALREDEPGHRAALRHCLPLFAGRDQIVVPADQDVIARAPLAGVAVVVP